MTYQPTRCQGALKTTFFSFQKRHWVDNGENQTLINFLNFKLKLTANKRLKMKRRYLIHFIPVSIIWKSKNLKCKKTKKRKSFWLISPRVTVWLDVLQATEKATERVEDIVAPSLDENKNKKWDFVREIRKSWPCWWLVHVSRQETDRMHPWEWS